MQGSGVIVGRYSFDVRLSFSSLPVHPGAPARALGNGG
jgi:hypothetical protein